MKSISEKGEETTVGNAGYNLHISLSAKCYYKPYSLFKRKNMIQLEMKEALLPMIIGLPAFPEAIMGGR